MEESTIRRHFPILCQAALVSRRWLHRFKQGVTWTRVKVAIALGLTLIWIGLRESSSTWHHVAGEAVAPGFRGAGVLGQALSDRGALRLTIMPDDGGRPAIVTFKQQTYLGNAGVTVHEVRVTDVQRGIERRRRFPSASVDYTEAG